VYRYLGQHYPTLIATTSSCARPSSSATLCLTLVVPVFAGRGESLRDVAVPDIISAIYTQVLGPPTPWCSPGALARFFPGDIGLTSDVTRSAHQMIPAMQLQQGETFRGCRHSLMFRLPRSLGLPIAPTAETQSLQGGQAVYTTQPPGWLPTPGCGIATHPTRATDATGLSPARLQPCRLLRHPSLQKELKMATRFAFGGPRRPASATAPSVSSRRTPPWLPQ
jgi:hypothetical protein